MALKTAALPKTPNATINKRANGHLSGLAGEFFVAAELLRRGYLVAVTMGNAKSVDLFVQDPTSGQSVAVQVKTTRTKNVWIISPEKVDPACVYIFVILNKPDERPDYYLVNGKELRERPNDFWPKPTEKLPGFAPKHLAAHKDAWSVFGDGGVIC